MRKNQEGNAIFCKKTFPSLLKGLFSFPENLSPSPGTANPSFSSIDPDLIPLYLISVFLHLQEEKSSRGIFLEVPNFALADRTNNALSLWAKALDLPLTTLLLPDGIS